MNEELTQDFDDEDDDDPQCIDCNAYLVTDSSVDDPTWPDCGPICWYCLIRRYEEAVKPRPGPATLVWSSDPPKVAGMYLAREKPDGSPFVVWVNDEFVKTQAFSRIWAGFQFAGPFVIEEQGAER